MNYFIFKSYFSFLDYVIKLLLLQMITHFTLHLSWVELLVEICACSPFWTPTSCFVWRRCHGALTLHVQVGQHPNHKNCLGLQGPQHSENRFYVISGLQRWNTASDWTVTISYVGQSLQQWWRGGAVSGFSGTPKRHYFNYKVFHAARYSD